VRDRGLLLGQVSAGQHLGHWLRVARQHLGRSLRVASRTPPAATCSGRPTHTHRRLHVRFGSSGRRLGRRQPAGELATTRSRSAARAYL
jgi:hypothetical protein